MLSKGKTSTHYDNSLTSPPAPKTQEIPTRVSAIAGGSEGLIAVSVLIGSIAVVVTSTGSDKGIFALFCSDTDAWSEGAIAVRAFVVLCFDRGCSGK